MHSFFEQIRFELSQYTFTNWLKVAFWVIFLPAVAGMLTKCVVVNCCS